MEQPNTGHKTLDGFFLIVLSISSWISGAEILMWITGVGGVFYALNQARTFFKGLRDNVKSIKALFKTLRNKKDK